MNYKQIADLYRQDDWGKCISNKLGVWFEVLEKYVYDAEVEIQTIPKGTKMKLISRNLTGWRFRFEEALPGFLGFEASFGRSRLLKLKLRETADIPSNNGQEEPI